MSFGSRPFDPLPASKPKKKASKKTKEAKE